MTRVKIPACGWTVPVVLTARLRKVAKAQFTTPTAIVTRLILDFLENYPETDDEPE
jgi:hypothetical protein